MIAVVTFAKRRVLLLLTVSALVGVALLPLSAQESSAVTATPLIVLPASPSLGAQPTEAELEDARRVRPATARTAMSSGDSLEWQNAFSLAVVRVKSRYPDDFTDAGIDPDRNVGWISFKGAAPADIGTLVGSLRAPVELRQDKGWSEEDIVSLGQALHYNAIASRGRAQKISTDIDASLGLVTLKIKPRVGAEEDALALAEGLRGAVTSVARSTVGSAGGYTVTVEVDSTADAGVSTVFGGGHLTTCTAGFSVSKAGYPNGLLTAAHCNNTQSYEGRNILTFRSPVLAGAGGDAQWHSSTEYASPYFVYTTGLERPLYTLGTPVVGMSLCKYGKTTANTCDTVRKLNQCEDIYCSLVMTEHRRESGGDSGGPWFWGNQGYGIHHGWKTDNLIPRSVFTPIFNVTSALGVSVKAL